MKQLKLLDRMFLLSETREVPMHVGGVNLYTLPQGVDDTSFLAELGEMPDIDARKLVKAPRKGKAPAFKRGFAFKRTEYTGPAATRRAYGNALVSLGKVNTAVVSIDGDVKNSTYAEDFFRAFPKRSFQCYIAEQNMVGMGLGMQAKGYIPFMATFAAFFEYHDLRATLLRFVQVAVQALVVALVDHRGVVRIVEQGGEHFFHRAGCRLDKIVHFLFRDEYVVRRQADLAGIHGLAHHDGIRRFLDVRRAANHHG